MPDRPTDLTQSALETFLDELRTTAEVDGPLDDEPRLLTLQPGQPGEGMDYNPRKPLPYPIFVGADDRCENVPGYPLVRQATDRSTLPVLVGFQSDVETQRVDLDADDWRDDPVSAVGMSPVFTEPGGFSDGMFNLAVVITAAG